ncbi:MAG: hypothetical protein KDA61_10305, partial [Planctomycetales bacterium]|nr:hypothetical protein [Planctomycetales bacterium]
MALFFGQRSDRDGACAREWEFGEHTLHVVEGDAADRSKVVVNASILAALQPITPDAEQTVARTFAAKHDA